MGPPGLSGEVEAKDDKKPKHRRPRRGWRVAALVAAGLVVAAAGGVAARAATESIPPPRTVVRLTSTVRAPGHAAALAWPSSGEAALATSSGKLIGSSGPGQPVPIASVAKVMTAYLVLQDHPLTAGSQGFSFTITPAEAATLPARIAQDESLVAVHAGQVLTERAALQAMLLPSADNIADDVATFDAGSLAGFVARMNQQAATMGMAHTHFADASGLDKATVSTPTDLLALARAAMAIPAFAAIVAEPSATVAGLGQLKNYNTLVGTDGFTGVKTGSTLAAGQALMFSVSRPVAGRSVDMVGVVLEQHGPGVVGGATQAARSLADSFYGQLKLRTVLPAGTTVATVSRLGRSATLDTARPLQLVTLPGVTLRLAVTVDPSPRYRSARVRTASAFGTDQTGTNTWVVPRAGLDWRLSHLL
ncbi:MAG TPA: hypothetical protein VFN68_15445 [Acidimicrobiales bacterium]|nr:hypothetical protein [Acidimicrobiales bacterium]